MRGSLPIICALVATSLAVESCGGKSGQSAGPDDASGGASSGGRGAGATTGDAGAPGSGGVANIGGTSGSAGAGGAAGRIGGAPGVDCYTIGRCKLGEACVTCSANTFLCVPAPDRDPDGYRAATAACSAPELYGVCDGPEDCNPGEYCVYLKQFPRAFRCSPEPAPEPIDCDIYNFPQAPSCTFCWTNVDCPAGQHCGDRLLQSGASGCLKDPG